MSNPLKVFESRTNPSTDRHLVTLSAKTQSDLDVKLSKLIEYLKHHPNVPIGNVAYTLNVAGEAELHRCAFVCRDVAEALHILESQDPERFHTGQCPDGIDRVAFMFSGVGDHYLKMAFELYQKNSVFAAGLNMCNEILTPYIPHSIPEILQYNEGASDPPGEDGDGQLNFRSLVDVNLDQNCSDEEKLLNRTSVIQPIMFSINYSLAQLLMSWGILPDAMVGYSIGEYLAACISGTMSLADTLTLVAERAKLIQQSPEGSMLAVFQSAKEMKAYLTPKISLAAQNSESTCVLAGDSNEIDRLIKELRESDVACRKLPTTHAFHSNMLATLSPALTEQVRNIHCDEPQIPYLSNVTGTWITEREIEDSGYWARHMVCPIQFYDNLNELLDTPDQVILEIGPGQSLGSFVRQHPKCTDSQSRLIFPTLRHPFEEKSDSSVLLETLGKMWLVDLLPDWTEIYQGTRHQRIDFNSDLAVRRSI